MSYKYKWFTLRIVTWSCNGLQMILLLIIIIIIIIIISSSSSSSSSSSIWIQISPVIRLVALPILKNPFYPTIYHC